MTLSFLRSIVHVHAGSSAPPAVAARRIALGRPAFANPARRYCNTVQRERLIRTLAQEIVRPPRHERPQSLSAPESSVAPIDGARQRTKFPRLPLTLVRRPAASGSAITEAAQVAPSAVAGSTRALGFERKAVPSALAPDELSRVTEHVLRTLDRRVLSHRERTGQV